MHSLPALDIRTKQNHSPHVVILGAGASRAAFPNGDALGIVPPLMADLIERTGLTGVFRDFDLPVKNQNFEELYDALSTSGSDPGLLETIERRVQEYFSEMRLPNTATLYDRLILSLRSKDLIATFNWDPYLIQSYRRNLAIKELPQIVFLHGNIGIGICKKDKLKGYVDQVCTKCGHSLKATKLLYPVRQKHYAQNEFIQNEWQILQNTLRRAYIVTIFGYAAPSTDIEARQLLLDAWKNNPTLPLAEIDIIDTNKRAILEKTWQDFIHKTHYGIFDDISNTHLLRHPRRSCEAFAMATLQQTPWRENKLPAYPSLSALHHWLNPLLAEENSGTFSGNPCPT